MALLGLQDQEKPAKDARPTRATNYARTSRPNIGQPDSSRSPIRATRPINISVSV